MASSRSVGHLEQPEPAESEGSFIESSSLQYNALPPEIWLKIFPHLSPEDLSSSTLACSSFRCLAQPFLFTVIDVSPFFLAFNADMRILRPRKYLDRTIQRLQFYGKKHIAPAVKHCWISPYSRSGFPPRNPRDYLEPHLVIDAVIEALPAFPNLRCLSWHCIDITSKWWDTIHKLPIKSLWLNSCLVEGVDARPLPVQRLELDQWAWKGEITNHVSIHEEHSSGVSRAVLPLVLHPDHIERISVPRSDTSDRLLSTMAEMNVFTSLRILRLPYSAISSLYFISALIQCPYLEELRIFNPTDDRPREISMDSLPQSSLPSLVVYEGPYTHLLTFAMGRSLRRISLWGLDDSSALGNPTRLLEFLRRLSLINDTLETLQISVSHITVDLLAIFSSFPQLGHLDIKSADNLRPTQNSLASYLQLSSTSPISVLYILLRDVRLPPRLETLRISTKLNHGNLDLPTQQLEVSRLIEGMARTYPSLRSAEITYGTYWTGTYIARWCRLASSDDKKESFGKLHFNEHRRTIVFPDAHRSENGWDQVGVAEGGISIITAWLRQFLNKYF